MTPYFFLSFIHSSMRILFLDVPLHILYSDCFESNPLASSLGITSRQSISDPSPRQNLRMAIWSLDSRQPGKLLTSKDGQAAILVRDRFCLSATAADTKVCLSLRAFALGETLREFELWAKLVLVRHFWGSNESACQTSLSDISSWQSTASQRHHNTPISPVISDLATPINSYSPQARSPLINNLLK